MKKNLNSLYRFGKRSSETPTGKPRFATLQGADDAIARLSRPRYHYYMRECWLPKVPFFIVYLDVSTTQIASTYILRLTDSTKINLPGHNIRVYKTNFRKPNAPVQQNVFRKI